MASHPIIYGDGEQSRDFTYIDNAVKANLLAAAADGVAGQAFNIACGERITLNSIIDELRSISGRDIEPKHTDLAPATCAIRSPTSPRHATFSATSRRWARAKGSPAPSRTSTRAAARLQRPSPLRELALFRQARTSCERAAATQQPDQDPDVAEVIDISNQAVERDPR